MPRKTRAQRIAQACLALARAGIALDAAYHAGQIRSDRWARRHYALTGRRIALEHAARVPEFKAGAVVADPRGARLTVQGWTLGDWSRSGVLYYTIDDRGVREIWPAESVRYFRAG